MQIVDDSVIDDVFEDEQPEKEVVLKSDYQGSVPELEHSFARYGDIQLVGHGVVTNPAYCGKFSYWGCLNVGEHSNTSLDGVNYSGKVYSRRRYHSCDKPSCPVCYKKGWAVREAGNIKVRLDEASKRFGDVEHIVISIPAKDYGYDIPYLRKKSNKILSKRGIIGGSLIYHGFRYCSKTVRKDGEVRYMGWYFSPHFHVLGFIVGGYSRCRNCVRKSDCLKGCGGFDDRNYWDGFMKDGYYVKVFGKRKSIFGTAWYQLNHASIDTTKKRFHVATWFGVCSYRKLKVTPKLRKRLCPICRSELVKLRYLGSKRLHLGDEKESFEDYLEDGKVAWVLAKVKNCRGGSSGESKYEVVWKDYVANQDLLVKYAGACYV